MASIGLWRFWLWRFWRLLVRASNLVRLNIGTWFLQSILWIVSLVALLSALDQLLKLPGIIKCYIISTSVHIGGLFAISIGAAVFALYTKELIKRIKKLPGGFELSTGGGIADLLSRPTLPALPDRRGEGGLGIYEERLYEKGQQILWHLEIGGLEVSSLRGKERENYVELVAKTGQYALAKKDFLKAVDILRKLEELRPLPRREIRFLALAYLWGREDERVDEKQKRKYLLEAVRNFELALREERYDPDLLYNLAWSYDELGLYDEAIKANRRAIDVGRSGEIVVGARYNIAVALIKKNQLHEALQDLERIPKGATWGDEDIWELAQNDPDILRLREPPGPYEAFWNLIRERANP